MLRRHVKEETPPDYLRRLEREARSWGYEGWCKSMGIDYSKTHWAQRIAAARQRANEWNQRKLDEYNRLFADLLQRRG